MPEKITLPNGLRIISVPKPRSLATTILVLVEAGSKYETKEISGISHFLEHMCFKGTKKRPRAIDIASELDGVGANYNAFTSMEYTGYFAKAQPKHLDLILDVLSDIYLNQTFNPEEIQKERGVIVEEINMYEDLPMRRVQELFTNLLYGDQPAGWDIAGRKEVVQKLNQEDFIKYQNEHYLAKSSLVVISGRFNEKEIVGKIQKYFSSIKSDRKTPKTKVTEHQEKPAILIKSKETDQTHLVLGVRAFNIFNEKRHALQILADVLGGGMSSRLFQKIREEMGVAYYIGADADLYTDHGYLAVSTGIEHSKIEKVIKAILEEFKDLSEKALSNEELQRVKEHLMGHLLINLETSDQLASFYGGQEIITQKIVTPEELLKKIQAVTKNEVMAAAKEIFQISKLNLALIGPSRGKDKFEKILNL